MGLSLKQIRQQAINLNNSKGGKKEKVFIRRKIEEFNREVAIHTRKEDELAVFFMKKVMKMKDPILRREVESMWKSFERMLDKKNYQIQHMKKLMIIAEDQLQYAIQYHCQAVDNMINYYFCTLDALAKENRKILNELFRCEEYFNENISMCHKIAETHFQILIFDANSKAESLKCTQEGINSMTEKEKRKRNSTKIGEMHHYYCKPFFNMWNEYMSIFRSYVHDTADINKKVRKLREKDKLLAGVIAAQAAQLQQSDDLIRQLQSELQSLESVRRTELHVRVNNYKYACKQLKVFLSEDCKSDEKQLEFLVRESNTAIDWLESARKKGETILKLAALSRKYETLREKVIPFVNALPARDSPHELETLINYTQSKKILTNNCGLTRLWQRISNAKLSYKALHQEKLLLEYENTILTQNVQGTIENTEINKDASGLKNNNESVVTLEGILDVQKYTVA